MFVIDGKDIKSYWSPSPYRRELKVYLSPSIHGTSNLIGMGMVIIEPGNSGNPHYHKEEQETWYILEGNGKLIIGNEEVQIHPDMVVVAPAGVEHQIFNIGNQTLKALFIFTPAGPEQRNEMLNIEHAVQQN